MKTIKLFLYAALIVVMLTLFNMWQVENKPKEQTQNQTISNDQSITVGDNTTQTKISENSNLKKINLIKPNKDKIIDVKNNVIEFSIDLNGGNIIKNNLLKYPEELNSKKTVELLNYNPDSYYTEQSGILNNNITVPTQQNINFTTKNKSFIIDKNNKILKIVLTGKTADGLSVEKIFTVNFDKYQIPVQFVIKNNSKKNWSGNYFMQINRIGKLDSKTAGFTMRSFFGYAVSSPKDSYQKYTIKKLKNTPINLNIKDGWLAMVQHYFITAWAPDPKISYRYYSRMTTDGIVKAGLISPKIILAPEKTYTFNSTFYSGPKKENRLENVSKNLGMTIDYGFLWFIAIILFKILKFIEQFVGNWGWSIIILTVLIKAAFYHLSASSYKSMAAMRKLQPKMAQLKERYGDDKQAMSKAMMELYKKEKVNPVGGCLPILIQIPVFIALYWVLLESVELRHAPFILWIHDLSAKDPYYILPVLMGITMYLQQKISPQPPDPNQAKMMMFLPVIMTVMFLWFPAGLVLYWLVNNILSVAQQYYITKKYEKGDFNKKSRKKK